MSDQSYQSEKLYLLNVKVQFHTTLLANDMQISSINIIQAMK